MNALYIDTAGLRGCIDDMAGEKRLLHDLQEHLTLSQRYASPFGSSEYRKLRELTEDISVSLRRTEEYLEYSCDSFEALDLRIQAIIDDALDAVRRTV